MSQQIFGLLLFYEPPAGGERLWLLVKHKLGCGGETWKLYTGAYLSNRSPSTQRPTLRLQPASTAPSRQQSQPRDPWVLARRRAEQVTGLTDLVQIEGFETEMTFLNAKAEETTVLLFLAKTVDAEGMNRLAAQHVTVGWHPARWAKNLIGFRKQQDLLREAEAFLGSPIQDEAAASFHRGVYQKRGDGLNRLERLRKGSDEVRLEAPYPSSASEEAGTNWLKPVKLERR